MSATWRLLFKNITMIYNSLSRLKVSVILDRYRLNPYPTMQGVDYESSNDNSSVSPR